MYQAAFKRSHTLFICYNFKIKSIDYNKFRQTVELNLCYDYRTYFSFITIGEKIRFSYVFSLTFEYKSSKPLLGILFTEQIFTPRDNDGFCSKRISVIKTVKTDY